MKDPSEATIEVQSAYPHEPAPPIARIDLDRFCEGCAYNLRTLPVYRDDRTGIPVVRCPECGRFQSANDASTAVRPWLNRVTSILLVGWILAIIAMFAHLCLVEGAMSYATLDELTSPAGGTIQRIGTTTTRIWSGYGPLEVNEDHPESKLFVNFMLTCSFAIGFVSGMLAVVVLPHWRRPAYAALVLVMPVLAGAVVATVWYHEAPHLFDWGLQHVASQSGMQLLGGLAGIIFGRPLARLGVHIFLPPGVRPRLAYLWLADNKPFPSRGL
ncbi:MAG: hypothetical protein ACYTFA_00415 [Planctomycetota bacterium]|jgi:hypothetical protein